MPSQRLKIHFIGIGGIGISALVRYFLKKGCDVSGSDLKPSEITDQLKKLKAKIFIGHKPSNLPKDADLVLITPAIKEENPELKEARRKGIKIQTWERALGEITKEYYTIGISGSHGKSTTTALVSVILKKAGLDPTVIIGTKLKEFNNSNFRFGKSKYLIIEADEYKNSFLNYWPKIIVLTNLEHEHPDCFKSLKQYLDVFKKYLSRLDKDGFLIANKDDKNVVNLTSRPKNATYYSLKQKEKGRLKKILKIPGEHNISNALAALAVARILKIPDKVSFKALSEYRGAWRRFEIHNIKINGKKIFLVSDYGHHPTQVKATIAAAKEKFPRKKIWIIYQAHQFLRTHYFFNDYVKAFDEADEIVLPEIYAVVGREKKEILKNLSARNLALALEKRFKKNRKNIPVHFFKEYKDIPGFLKSRVKNNDVILLMGAGDIYDLTLHLTNEKKRKRIYQG